MKQIIFLVLAMFVPSTSISQDLNGIWSGEIVQRFDGRIFRFNIEANVVHKGEKISGKRVSVQAKTKNYTVTNFSGSLKEGIVKIYTDEIVKVDYPQSNYRFITFGYVIGALKIDEINNIMVIEGVHYGNVRYNLKNKKISKGNSRSSFRLSKKIIETESQRLEEELITPVITNKKEIIVIDEKEIKLFTKTVKMKVWDSYEEDGDFINLYLNGKILFSDLKVSKKGEIMEIELQSGENIILVEALNEGTISPNTSAITVFVNNQQYEIILSAKKGERDSLKIILD